MRTRFFAATCVPLAGLLATLAVGQSASSVEIDVARDQEGLRTAVAAPDEQGRAVFWLPDDADGFVLPMVAGIVLDGSDPAAMAWLRAGSPWDLVELPLLGVRYGDRTLAVIVPWPQYAQLEVGARIGIAFQLPPGRRDATPCSLLAGWTDNQPLAIARVWREWRRAGQDLGSIPPTRTLAAKIADLPNTERLLGAAHFYLWGSSRFSRHDIARPHWIRAARHLLEAPADSPCGAMVAAFDPEARSALTELAAAQWPTDHLTGAVARSIDAALCGMTAAARDAWVAAMPSGLRPRAQWGDGASLAMLDNLQDAGVDRAVLLTSDLRRRAVRRDVAQRADHLGYVFGPYDSYHSVHAPDAHPDATWETAQFDRRAYEEGRVLNADGSGHAGFRNRGFHFAPAAAWPYVQERVHSMLGAAPFSAWFVDCDATAECFDDYSPDHPATRWDDLRLRRARLSWLERRHGLVVGSEGGSALFSDVVHFGHGVDTPYIGHLDPAMRDRASPHFLGRHWPPDTPQQSFLPVPVAPRLRSPYFDPAVRIPLYRAALGDEVVTSHHWSLDSLKLADVAGDRELLGILAATPPMFHLSRAAWPQRREAILRHYRFWSPLHRAVATAPLVEFWRAADDGLVQRATYRTSRGDVRVAVNFAQTERDALPPRSATVSGIPELEGKVYRVR